MTNSVIGYTAGAFDMFHIGHLNLLKNAKEQCDYLFVGVNSDNLIQNYKQKKAVIPIAERIEIVRSIKYVDQALVVDSLDKVSVWNEIHFKKIFIGDDWKGSERWRETEKELAQLGTRVIYLPYTTGTTSTLLLEKLVKL
jgi:glycerol-3-phosphate cytidylyltransferase